MLWKGRRQSDNIEDRRGEGGGFPGGFGGDDGPGGGFRIPIGGSGGGGLSLKGIIILIILFFVLKAIGIDPMQFLGQGDMSGGHGTTVSSNQAPANDEMKQFVATVLAETEDTWSGIFKAQGRTYQDPTLVLFSGATQSGCGTAQRAMGPFYCPNDRKVYLDTAFFRQLSQQFHASGDFAQAYVIAHEVGHHVQNLIGILPKFDKMRQQMSTTQANAMSVRVELQADCFAGIWAHYTQQTGIVEKGDIDEALNAASQIGDDTLQKETQGYVVPDSFTHGTSAERKHWFQTGYQSGKLQACDTFNSPI